MYRNKNIKKYCLLFLVGSIFMGTRFTYSNAYRSQETIMVPLNISVGKEAIITVLRAAKEKKISVKLGKRKDDVNLLALQRSGRDPFGMQLSELIPSKAEQFGYKDNEKEEGKESLLQTY